MRNVGSKHTPGSKLFLVALTVQLAASPAMAKIVFFHTSVPRMFATPSVVAVAPPAPITVPATLPGIVAAPIIIAISGGQQKGNMKFATLASVPPVVAAAANNIQGLNVSAPGLGGLTMPSPAAARNVIETAKIALGTAEMLLKAAGANTSQNEAVPESKFALNLPVGAWPQGSVYDSGKEGYEYAEAPEIGAPEDLLAYNGKRGIASDRAAAWKELDQKALEFTYSMQFVGYGILHDDGPVFVTWAIAHAVRMSNNLNNSVINELQTVSTYPKSKLRDDKIHALLAYVKNPSLKKINGWLATLRDGLLQSEDTEVKQQ